MKIIIKIIPILRDIIVLKLVFTSIYAIVRFLIRPKKSPQKELVFGNYQVSMYPKINIYLWVGIFVGIILWFVSLFSI